MTYFNPSIFNKQNLKEEDRTELDFWNGEVLNCIENTKEEYQLDNYNDVQILRDLKNQIVDDFCALLKSQWGCTLQENVVSLIDNYDEDVEEVENPDTYYYEGDKADD